MEDPFLFKHSSAAELFIVRHADAIPEADEIISSGIYDDLPLSGVGREQARALAEHLGLKPVIVPELTEIRLGEVVSLPQDGNDLEVLYKALQERQLEIVRIAGTTGNWDAIAGSEPSREFRKRVVTALDEIANRHIGERVLVFAHGGVVNAYAAEVLGLERDFFYPAANTAISVVRVAGTHRVLFTLNDLGHLGQLRRT